MSRKHKLIIWCFKPWLQQAGLTVVKVKRWGIFLVDSKSGQRQTVEFEWWKGLI